MAQGVLFLSFFVCFCQDKGSPVLEACELVSKQQHLYFRSSKQCTHKSPKLQSPLKNPVRVGGASSRATEMVLTFRFVSKTGITTAMALHRVKGGSRELAAHPVLAELVQ